MVGKPWLNKRAHDPMAAAHKMELQAGHRQLYREGHDYSKPTPESAILDAAKRVRAAYASPGQQQAHTPAGQANAFGPPAAGGGAAE